MPIVVCVGVGSCCVGAVMLMLWRACCCVAVVVCFACERMLLLC